MVSINGTKRSKAAYITAIARGCLCLVICPLLCLTACLGSSGPSAGGSLQADTEASSGREDSSVQVPAPAAPELPGLTLTGSCIPEYADEFALYDYEGGYTVLEIHGDTRYLLAESGAEAPENLPGDMVFIGEPKDIYLCATSAMALLDACGGLSNVTFSSLEADGWYVDAGREAMEEGRILYAGKYSTPDYETLLSESCDLAVESTMIFHHPEVKEMLEKTGIPVLVDYSGYERHPLGRAEWVILYGALTGHREEAEAFFAEQKRIMEALGDAPNTGKKAAFFYINASGLAVVRTSDDYIPKMMELAGGGYVPDNLPRGESNSGSVTISMEEFYQQAADADILIYNGIIDGAMGSLQDLMRKDEVFADFRAVKEGNCWTTDRAFHQQTAVYGEITGELQKIFSGSAEELRHFSRLE